MDKKELLERYKKIQEQEKLINETHRKYLHDVMCYRINSTIRVLEFIKSKDLTKDKMETYVVHCLNKLNGCIDGIELELKDDKKQC